jgi:hypothetical protein
MNLEQKYLLLQEEFEQYRKESIKWSVDDFIEHDYRGYTITRGQAQKALERMIAQHDATIGITWDTIGWYIREFGTPITKDNDE